MAGRCSCTPALALVRPIGYKRVMTVEIQTTKTHMFVVRDGIRIAKHGLPGTPEAGRWVSLHPNYVVSSPADGCELIVEYIPDGGEA